MNKKCVCVHMYSGIIAVKRNELSIHATTWIDHETVMLSERSQTKRRYRFFVSIYTKF